MSENPLKILLLGPLPPPFGGISHWVQLISDHVKKICDVKLVIINTSPPKWRAVHDFSIWKRIVGGGYALILMITKLLINLGNRPNTIHITSSGQLSIVRDIILLTIARIYRIPALYHIRFGRVPQLADEKTIEWYFFSKAIQLAHTVIAIDENTKKTIQKNFQNANVVNIPNCIDFNLITKSYNDYKNSKTVLFIGWVIPSKGIEELVCAWKTLNSKSWKLLIVGPANAEYIDQLIERYHPKRITFIGEKNHKEAMRLMNTSDIFVLPSYTEGFPNVILEAMAYGKAIIASDVGAIPEMLKENCGVLIKPGDIEGLMYSLKRLFSDKKLRLILGENACLRANTAYSVESVFERYLKIWKETTYRDLR